MDISIRLADANNVETHELPDIESFTISPVFCDAGAIEFSYPTDGINFDQISTVDEFRVRVYLNGVYRPELDSWVKDVDGDNVTESGAWKFTGWLANGRFQEAVVYPEGWPTYNPDEPGQFYTDNTPGYFFRKLIVNEAQQRGALAGMFLDNIVASNTTDGQAWGRLISVELKPGTDYLEVFRDLYEDEICEWEVVGNQIKAYNYGTYGTDRTIGANPLTFREGRDLVDAPRKKTSRERYNAILAEGAEGVYVERKDTPEINARRRVEGTYNNSEIKWQSTLDAYAAVELQRAKFPAVEVTVGLSFADSATPIPLINFTVGDWVYCDTNAGLERLRIIQWVLTKETDGTYTGSVTMGRAFQGRVSRLRKQFKKLVRGKTKSGTSKRTPTALPGEAADNMPPAAPTSVTGFGVPYIDANQYFAKITASWSQVTTNEDGSILTDLHHYLVSYRQTAISTNWSPGQDAGLQTSLTWYPVGAGMATEVRVAAVDKWGNISAWSSPVASFTTPGDTDPPPVPSTPIVDSYLGMLRVRWDGSFVAAAAQPFDFNRVEVHVGGTSGFTPSNNTLIASLRTTGYALTKFAYGSNAFAKLIAVDELGNKSAASATSAGVATTPVVSADIFDGAVGTQKLADLAVTTAKINDLAVNNAKIGDLDVGKLTAGTMSALVTLSGRIATALTGARTEMNSAGFYRFDATGNTLVAIDNAGNLLTGTFKTALTGRRIEMVSGGTSGDINLIAPDGKRGFVRSYTQATGQEAIQFGMTITTGAIANILWNRITYNSSAAGEYATYRSGTHEFVYDATAPNNGRFVVFGTESRGEDVTRIRMQIDDGGTNFWYPLATGFIIWDRSDATGTARTRFWLSSTNVRIYHMTGGDTSIMENVNGTLHTRLQIGDVEDSFRWPSTSMGIYIRQNDDYSPLGGSGNGSPFFKLMNHHGYAATLEYRASNTGTNANLHVKDANASGYCNVVALAFNPSSARERKRNIRSLQPESVRNAMAAAKVYTYLRSDQLDTDIPVMGIMADEAMEGVRVNDEDGNPMAVDLYSLTSAILAYAQNLDARLATVEKRGPSA